MLEDNPAVTVQPAPLLSVSVGVDKVYCVAGRKSWRDIINGGEMPMILVREDLQESIFLLPSAYAKILTEFLFCADNPQAILSVVKIDGLPTKQLLIDICSDASKPRSQTVGLLFSLSTKAMLLSTKTLKGISEAHTRSMFYTSDGAPILCINSRCDDSVNSFEPETASILARSQSVAKSAAAPTVARLCLLLETFDEVRDDDGNLPDFLQGAGVDDVANDIAQALRDFAASGADEFPEQSIRDLNQRVDTMLTELRKVAGMEFQNIPKGGVKL